MGSQLTRVAFGAATVALWLPLLYLYNLWPGHARDMASRLLELGIVECFARQGPVGGWLCQSMGFPAGYHVAFGLPVLFLKGMVVRATGLASLTSDTIVDAVFLGVGLVGAIALLRHLGLGRWLALLGTYLYLSSPVIYAQGGYGALRIGFVLVPAYVWLDQRLRSALVTNRDSTWEVWGLGAAVVAARVFALFTDGYSFVMSTMLSGALLVPWMWRLLRASRFRPALEGGAAFVVSALVASAGYTAYFPGGDTFAVMEVDVFRGQGVDLYALLVPSYFFLLPVHAGWAHDLVPWQAYTDGPPIYHTYLGLSLLAGAALVPLFWSRGRYIGRDLLAVAAVGAVAFVLSLGPSLKVADFREPGVFDMSNPYQNYVMPAEAATMNLGTARIYRHVPGINVMRALYRWHVLVRLALIAIALVGIQSWLRAGRHPLVVWTLCCVALLELFPNVGVMTAAGLNARRMLDRFDSDLVEPLTASLRPGDRVLLQPCLLDTPRNDWMASYVCGRTGSRCYNAGGDKAIVAAARAWPPEVLQVMTGRPGTLGNIERLFDRDELDLDRKSVV